MSADTEAPWYAKYQVDVPEGRSGQWSVERFTVSEETAKMGRLRDAISGVKRGSQIRAGAYTRLMQGGAIVMSDTPAEIREHMDMVHRAQGRILINGLGLGMVLQACLTRRAGADSPFLVEHATVIEGSSDVMALVAPHYLQRFGADRLHIIHADAFDWQPPKGVRYQAIWHDIWTDICTDNLPEYTRLKRKYGQRTDWQGCWMEDELRRADRRGY